MSDFVVTLLWQGNVMCYLLAYVHASCYFDTTVFRELLSATKHIQISQTIG